MLKLFWRAVTACIILCALAVAGFYLFLRSGYVVKPLVEALTRETGSRVQIDHIEYNPLYPGVILANGVRAGDFFSADQLYVEFDYKELLSGALSASEVTAVNMKLDLSKAKDALAQAHPNLIKSLVIKDMNLKNAEVIADGWIIRQAIIEMHDLVLLKNGKPQMPEGYKASMFAEHVTTFGQNFHSVNAEAKLENGIFDVSSFRADYRDGRFGGSFSADPATKTIKFRGVGGDHLDLSGHGISDAFAGWDISIMDGDFHECALDLPGFGINTGIGSVDLQINDFQRTGGSIERMSLSGSAKSVLFGGGIFSELEFHADRLKKRNAYRVLLSGIFEEGKFDSYSIYEPDTDFLDIRELSLDGSKFHGSQPGSLAVSLAEAPFAYISVRHADASHIDWKGAGSDYAQNVGLSAVDLSFRGGDLLASETKGLIRFAASAIGTEHSEISDMSAKIVTNAGIVSISDAKAILNGGTVTAIGAYDTNAEFLSATLTGDGIGLNLLSRWIPEHAVTGKFSFKARIAGMIDDLGLNARVSGDDIYINGFSLPSAITETRALAFAEKGAVREAHLVIDQISAEIIKERGSVAYRIKGDAETLEAPYRLTILIDPQDRQLGTINIEKVEKDNQSSDGSDEAARKDNNDPAFFSRKIPYPAKYAPAAVKPAA